MINDILNEADSKMDKSVEATREEFAAIRTDAELNQTELARLIGVEGPTMIRMLDSLAREGLIERQQSHHDLRVTINRITGKGRQVITEIMGVTNALRREVLDGVDLEELKIANRVLSGILRRLEQLTSEGVARKIEERARASE